MPDGLVELAAAAEQAGFDAAWTGESWGSDAFLAAGDDRGGHRADPPRHRRRAVGGPHPDGHRHARGDPRPHLRRAGHPRPRACPAPRWWRAGTADPRRGRWPATREFVEILRRVFERSGPLAFEGEHFQHPYAGEGAEGLGKPLKIMTHPLRPIPIWIGAEGPRNVAQTVEIARRLAAAVLLPDAPRGLCLTAGPAPRTASRSRFTPRFVCASPTASPTPCGRCGPASASTSAAWAPRARTTTPSSWPGWAYEEAAYKVQRLFLEGRRDDAIAAVPQEFADEISLVGPPERIRDRLQAWKESPVTMLNVAAQHSPGMPPSRRTSQGLSAEGLLKTLPGVSGGRGWALRRWGAGWS